MLFPLNNGLYSVRLSYFSFINLIYKFRSTAKLICAMYICGCMLLYILGMLYILLYTQKDMLRSLLMKALPMYNSLKMTSLQRPLVCLYLNIKKRKKIQTLKLVLNKNRTYWIKCSNWDEHNIILSESFCTVVPNTNFNFIIII